MSIYTLSLILQASDSNEKKISLILFIVSIFFSLAGWINYGRFVFITSIHPDFSIEEYNEKYFANYPLGLKSIDNVNMATLIILILAIGLLVISGYLGGKSKIFPYVILILNGIVIGMLFLAYM